MINSSSSFLTASKKYCMSIQTPKETNHEITETERKGHKNTFISDIDVEKSCFLSEELKSVISNF